MQVLTALELGREARIAANRAFLAGLQLAPEAMADGQVTCPTPPHPTPCISKCRTRLQTEVCPLPAVSSCTLPLSPRSHNCRHGSQQPLVSISLCFSLSVNQSKRQMMLMQAADPLLETQRLACT